MNRQRTEQTNISDHDRFGMTFFLATIFHGMVILGVTFSVSQPADSKTSPAMDIILVQTKAPNEVEDAEYLAQISQQGGGTDEDKSRPRELFSAQTISNTPGMSEQNTVKQVVKLKQHEQISLLTRDDSDFSIRTENTPVTEDEAETIEATHTSETTQSARLAPEISNKIEHQASMERTKFLNSSTKEFVPAQYMRQWINRVERIGNLNYPDQARRNKLSGTLILDVVIGSDGKLIKTDLRQSSGHQVLDDAAKRIVRLASPFSAFPRKLREDADVIHITRSWEFLNNSKLRTR